MLKLAASAAAVSVALSVALSSVVFAQEAPELSLAESAEYGAYVTGPEGRPVYVFVTDEVAGDNLTPLVSCGEPCREVWPLVTVETPGLGVAEGLLPELVATIQRDGKNVAVYGSNVLWHFARDEPGVEPQGHAISTYGGWWYLVGPDGVPLDRNL